MYSSSIKDMSGNSNMGFNKKLNEGIESLSLSLSLLFFSRISSRWQTDIGCSRSSRLYRTRLSGREGDAATPITRNPSKTRARRTIPLIRERGRVRGINNLKCERFQLGLVVRHKMVQRRCSRDVAAVFRENIGR